MMQTLVQSQESLQTEKCKIKYCMYNVDILIHALILFHGLKKGLVFVFSILLVGLSSLLLLKTRFHCTADLPAKYLHVFHLIFIVNIRLKKHPSFKRKAFLPTRRRATLVSVFK